MRSRRWPTLRRKLRAGGKLCLYLLAFHCLYSSIDTSVGHFHRYTKTTLRGKFDEVGFKNFSLSYADTFGFVMTLLF